MLLRNLHSVTDNKTIDILIEGKDIVDVSNNETLSNKPSPSAITFHNAIVFPGIINSHDHLDFNLFPRLGNKIYNSYTEWGPDIHTNNKDTINSVLNIPKELRVQWGLYKNLLCGVTTVVNHGDKLDIKENHITVLQNSIPLHSPGFEKNWKLKLNNPFLNKAPIAIHVGEGTNHTASKEIDDLINWNLFHREIIGIHGVAMNEAQASRFKALVWCPDSNYFLLGKTASIDKLKTRTNIIFGTDSTLSASWNIWEHLQIAKATNMVSDLELFEMLTQNASKAWDLPHQGNLNPGSMANIVVAKQKQGLIGLNAFFAPTPQDILIVLHQGQIVLFDETILNEVKNAGLQTKLYSKITYDTETKYVIGDLPKLITDIRSYYPSAIFPVSPC